MPTRRAPKGFRSGPPAFPPRCMEAGALAPKVQQEDPPAPAPVLPGKPPGRTVTGAPSAQQEHKEGLRQPPPASKPTPAARKSAPAKPPMALGATAKGKVLPGRAAAHARAQKETPREESASSYYPTYSSSQGSEIPAQEDEGLAGLETPPVPGEGLPLVQTEPSPMYHGRISLTAGFARILPESTQTEH